MTQCFIKIICFNTKYEGHNDNINNFHNGCIQYHSKMIIYLLLGVIIFVFSSVHGLIIRPINESEIVNNAISSLATDLSQRYFSHVRCLVLVTDTLLSKTFLQYLRLPNYIPVVQDQSINQDCNNPHLQNILEFAYSQYCNG